MEGQQGANSFSAYHPVVELVFFVFAIGITMFSMEPVCLAVSLALGWAWSLRLGGRRAMRMNLLLTVPILVLMTLGNALFTHNGATVLFYLNGNRITLEAAAYGAAAAVLLSAVIVWFSCMQRVMTTDRFVYLFGKAAPVLGMTLSMIFRFLPLLKVRYRQVVLGQRCMGRHGQGGPVARARQKVKEVSILISWSLEASIETADSMEARGYGLKGRTAFHLFRFTGRDGLLLALILALGGAAAAGCLLGKTSIYYYPVIVPGDWDAGRILTCVAMAALMALPVAVDRWGERKWKRSACEG